MFPISLIMNKRKVIIIAFLKQAKTPQEIKMIGVAAVRNAYNDLASDYNKIIDYDWLFCHKCGEFLAATTFYTDDRFATGKFPICKRCVMAMVEQRKNKNDKPNETKESVQEVLRLMDLPYIDSFYEDCVKGAYDEAKEKNRTSPFTTYNTAVRSLPQWKGMTWKDSDFGINGNPDDDQLSKRKPRKEIVKLFGSGFSNEDYLYLQDQYDDWCSRTQVDSKSQQTYVAQICMQLLDIYKDRKASRDVTKKLDALDKLMNSARLQPKQNVDNSAADSLTFGQLIEKWENEKPIPEPSDEFKDVDGIGKYIRVWFTGWLSKALGLKANVFTQEYDEEISKYVVEKPDELEEGTSSDIYDRLFGSEGGD